jgi:hypothetical protein
MRSQEEMASWIGCTVEEMNADHDRLHEWLADMTGLHSYSMDVAYEIPLTDEEFQLANYEEDAVLNLQRYLYQARKNGNPKAPEQPG